MEHINTAINEMGRVTQQNAAMVEESTAATHTPSKETGQLAELVGQFRLKVPGTVYFLPQNGGCRLGGCTSGKK